MIYLHFKDKTVIPFKDLKSAYICFMSNSRFFVHKLLENFSKAIVYKDNIKIYEWIYCEELNPVYIDDNFDSDDFSEPIVFCPGSYYFFSKEVKKNE